MCFCRFSIVKFVTFCYKTIELSFELIHRLLELTRIFMHVCNFIVVLCTSWKSLSSALHIGRALFTDGISLYSSKNTMHKPGLSFININE